MPSTSPGSSAVAPGYALLLWVDLTTGRHNGSETIFVPLGLAQTLNAARRELYDKRTRPDAWERACAIQTPPAPPEDELDLDPEDSAAQLRAVRERIAASASVPRPTAVPAPVAGPTTRRCRTAAGQALSLIHI